MSISINIPASALSDNSSSASDLGPLPKGTYEATIYNIVAEEVKGGANAGKPRWNVQFRISEGQYENRRLFSYIPLYVAGDFWKTQGFFEALGFDMKAGKFSVPAINDLLGKPIKVRVTVREAEGDYPADNNVSGFSAVTSGAAALAGIGATPASGEDLWVE